MAGMERPALHLRLLGGFDLSFEGRPITAVDAPRLQSLLAHLVLHRDARHPRERLAVLFWPDSEESQARTNLRQALHHLRRALPDSGRFLESEARAVGWRADAPLVLDVAEFEQLVARAERAREAGDERRALQSAVAIYAGDLVPGCYDDWIVPERERLRAAFLAAAERLAELLELEREYRAAIPWARQLLDHDPLNEAACRRLMRLHALGGDRAAALRVYHGFATALAREAGVEPSAVTRDAHERLLEAEAARPPADTARPATGASQFVGRRQEWETLRRTWQRAAEGEALLALISGEAGMGKTRLCEELVDWVGRQGIVAADSRCYSAAGALAYAPIVELLRSESIGAGLRRLGEPWLVSSHGSCPSCSPSGPSSRPRRR